MKHCDLHGKYEGNDCATCQSGGRVPGDGLGFYLIVIVVCITFGIYCGMKMAGG